MNIVLIILIELIFIAALILFLYRLKPWLGLVPLYVVLGSNQLFVTMLGTKFDVDILGGLSIPAGPSIIFSAGFFAILLIYIKEGIQTTQRLIIAIVVTNLSLTILNTLANWQEIILTGSSSSVFYSNFRVFGTGMLTLVLDAFILIILYEFLYTKLRMLNLYSRLTLALLIILNFDALLFVTGSFWDRPDYSSRLLSHIVGKSVAALFFSAVLYIYLSYMDKEKNNALDSEAGDKIDIFSILTYKGRFEKLQIQKTISDENMQRVISEKNKELEKSVHRFTIMASLRELRMDKFTSSDQAGEFLKKVQEAFEIDACCIHLLQEDKLEILSCVGMESNEWEQHLDEDSSFIKKVINSKSCMWIEDTDKEPGRKNELSSFIYKSCIAAPMIIGNKVSGVIILFALKEKRVFTTLEQEHLHLIANQLINSIENNRLFEQNEKQKEILVKQIIARKKTEEIIKESEEKFRTLMQQAADGILLCDLDGNYLDVNDGAEKITGYSIDELKIMNGRDIVPAEELKKHPLKLEEIKKGGSVYIERIIRNKNGTLVNVEISAKLMGNDKVINIMRDITERKKTEQKLKESREKYYSFFDQSADAIFIFNETGHFLTVNAVACSLLGYTRKELRNLSVYDIIFKEDIATNPIRLDLLCAGETVIRQRVFKRKDGSPVDVEVNSKKLSDGTYLGVVRDITERKKTEYRMLMAIERYDILSQATSDTIWDWNIVKNRMLYNEGITKVFGYNLEEAENVADWWKKNIHSDDLPGISALLNDVFSNKIQTIQMEYRFRCADETYKYIYDRAFVIYGEAGKPIRMIGAMQDITYKKEEEIRTGKAVIGAQENERQQIGMELHDNVSQILAASKLYLGMSKNVKKNRPQMEESIDTSMGYINDAIAEIRRLSHQLAPASYKDTSIKEVFESLVKTMNSANQWEINLDVDNINENDINNDMQVNLYRILQEQLNNILKYAKAKKVAVSVKVIENQVILRIADDGIGFDPLKVKGGIGLENMKRRTEIFSGKLTIVSSPGNGCDLVIKLPVEHSV